jgi:hypothetical protein
MKNTDQIHKALEYYFQHPKSNYAESEIPNTATLVEDQILMIDKDGNFKFNFLSSLIDKTLNSMAFDLLGEKISENIPEALAYISKFDKQIKVKYNLTSYNPYSEMLLGFKINSLKKLNKDKSVYFFLTNLLQQPDKRPKYLADFEVIYFDFLDYSEYTVETIYLSCVELWDKNKEKAYPAYKYLAELGKKNWELAFSLYKHGKENGIERYPGYAPNLLSGLYNAGRTEVFSDTIDLVETDVFEGMKAFSAFDIKSSTEIEDIYNITKDVQTDTVAIASQKSYSLCKIAENKYVSEKTREACFLEILTLLKSDNVEIVNAVFNNVQYNLLDFEYEKYSMLWAYINNTKNFEILENFFYQFKEPKYMFDFMVRMYEVHGFRSSIDRFHNTIIHFWSEFQAKTEQQILNLFSQRHFGLLSVKIMFVSHEYPLQVDLLKLDDEIHQKNAIEAMCIYPHSFDKLVPILLKLRFSKYEAVKELLQEKLANSIFETYHESLYNAIIPELDAKLDKKLLNHLKKALAEYNKLKELKSRYNDLNPIENERELMDLYYRLEHENQAKIMQEGKKDGFSSLFKNVMIARGNAWKHDDKEQILPLQKIESSMLIDSNAYKNPIAYEQNLENF